MGARRRAREIGRVSAPAREVLAELSPVLELIMSTAPFDRIVAQASTLTWTRDPFDRLIAGNALADRADLLTADQTMRRHLPLGSLAGVTGFFVLSGHSGCR